MRVGIALVALIAVASASNWALLIAGSNGYYNYRHQADVAHAYQVLKKGGFPAERVVTMIFDDVAHDPQNPKKGQLFNKPNGTDVYSGIVIDYKGADVNADNFLKVLSGNAGAMKGKGTGKVVASTADDNVFVFYSDHGGFGLVAMPSGPFLYSNQLNATLQGMVDAKKFKHLAFYLEACESGSMFDKILPGNEQIWAITASNPNESSYAYYYDATLKTYLGDEFSIHWMEDSDASTMAADYTLENQFEKVQGLTKESHVCKYGEADLASLPIGTFQLFEKFPGAAAHALRSNIAPRPDAQAQPVDVREIEIEILRNRLADETDPATRAEIQEALGKEIAARDGTDRIFKQIVKLVTTDREVIDHPFDSPRDYECLKASLDDFEGACGVLSGYGLKYVRTVSALCDHGFKFDKIHPAIQAVCHHAIA